LGRGTIWVGIDDTDSPLGGCTTWVLTELLDEARATGVDLIGEPRLVRLNPNIPWKTRGNAALSARFGVGQGRRRRVGEIGQRPVWSYRSGRPLSRGAADEWLDRAWSRVLAASRTGEPGTDPALVATERPLPASLYWNAVREVVEVSSVRKVLDAQGAFVRSSGTDRGIVGASAAIAWRETHPTWERIAYRSPERWDHPRDVNAASVRRARSEHPGLFLSDDPRTRRVLIAPHTPCPILYGLRGITPRAPLDAARTIESEPVDRWVLFRTNQGTGDHLSVRTALEVPAFGSGIVHGTIAAAPEVLAGGHVRLNVVDATGAALPCLAFEPTKTLPRVARSLVPGDRVRVWGSRGEGPTFRLEGIELVRLEPRTSLPHAPRCTPCGRSGRSLGRLRGYRCPDCRRRWPPEAAVRTPRPALFGEGVYHPTPSARRHLAPRGPEP
jgi:tRNA(Ile2)-agmatinylcytidine synthase